MTAIIIFIAIIFIVSLLVLSALMLSSRLSQNECVEETYEQPKPHVTRGKWGELL